MDLVEDYVLLPADDFYKASKKLVKNCTKPDWSEFSKLTLATFVGFMIMGAIGFFVKLVAIPLNNILVGGQ